jgi:hypothetical protein
MRMDTKRCVVSASQKVQSACGGGSGEHNLEHGRFKL